MIKEILMAGIGGFVGSSMRFVVGKLATSLVVCSFPIGTFIVNVIGCMIIGIIIGYGERTQLLTQNMSILLITGFCGGFTTFSSFSNEIFVLIQLRQWFLALAYLLMSVICGLGMVWVGRLIAK